MIEVTFSLDTSAYASGDVLADTQVLCASFDRMMLLNSFHLLDEDDQGVAMSLIFTTNSASLGTENSAPSISDANARDIFATAGIATADWLDIGGARSVTKTGLGIICPSAALYVAILNSTGTPTFSANGLRGKFFFTPVQG